MLSLRYRFTQGYLMVMRYRLPSLILALVSLAVIIGAPDTYPIQPPH